MQSVSQNCLSRSGAYFFRDQVPTMQRQMIEIGEWNTNKRASRPGSQTIELKPERPALSLCSIIKLNERAGGIGSLDFNVVDNEAGC